MNHFATPEFWHCYRHLPKPVQQLADKNFALLRNDAHDPSIRFKQIGVFYSARVGLHFRALAWVRPEGAVWFWIGRHDEYERFLKT